MKENKQQFQGALLGSKRFLPLFVTQFFSALNDNVYKQSILLILIFQAATVADGAFILTWLRDYLFCHSFYFRAWLVKLQKSWKNQS
jgi:hypothetical protein